MSDVFTKEIEMQLYQIATFLKADIKQQLLDDGHRATGELIESIETVVAKGLNVFTIEGYMGKQGLFIINGRKAGAKGVPIDALVKWIENKGFSDGARDTKGIAFAIQKTIIKEGIEPDDFIGKVFEKDKDLISKKINDAAYNALNVSLTNLINNAKNFA